MGEEGEKNTKFFLGLEKARQTRKNITALKDNNGKLIKKQSKILELEREYYITLYETKNPDPIKIEEYIEATNIENKLSRDESNAAEGELTIEECSKSVFQMKLNKAPGIDGLTVEFYRTFWPFLKHFAVKVFNNCYVKEELSNTQKIGLISLIYKKNDPLSLDNYRPITLLVSIFKRVIGR